MRQPLSAAAVLFAALWVVQPAPARAGEGAISIEVNKLEQREAACRTTIVLRNGSGMALRTLKLDLVIFGTDDVVARRLALETAPLPAGKTSVTIFDMSDQPCAGVGSILLNDILECADEGGPRPDCLDLVETGSRTTASFIK